MCFDGGLGSSPLARGTHAVVVAEVGGVGLIPARAGNTPNGTLWKYSTRAHPRSRGGHPSTKAKLYDVSGSSPLARGTRSMTCFPLLVVGLIPARAGNTSTRCPIRTRSRAHPRSRGEHLMPAIAILAGWGSSPLARGTPLLNRLGVSVQGLIPARAGNTGGRFLHLRLRSGSSPLARGTLFFMGDDGDSDGLIPARAGNT